MKKGDKIKIVKSSRGCVLDDGETVTLLCKSTLDSSDWMVERSNGGRPTYSSTMERYSRRLKRSI